MASNSTAIYGEDGVIIRYRPVGDDAVEVEIDYLFISRTHALLYGLAEFYLAFRRALDIEFVLSDYTGSRAVVAVSDFDERAQQTLIAAVKLVRQFDADILGDAQNFYFVDEPGVLETNPSGSLRQYRDAEFKGKRFVEILGRSLPPLPS
jgi:hypothetical protein